MLVKLDGIVKTENGACFKVANSSLRQRCRRSHRHRSGCGLRCDAGDGARPDTNRRTTGPTESSRDVHRITHKHVPVPVPRDHREKHLSNGLTDVPFRVVGKVAAHPLGAGA